MKLNKGFIILIVISLNILSSQTLDDYNKFKKLYEESQKGQISNDTQSLDIDKTKVTVFDTPNKVDLIVPIQSVDSLSNQSKYFGYDYFSQRDSIPFWPNVSSPDNYILGPGDNIEISLWGRAQLHESYTINRDGNIYNKSIGIIHLNGKTLKEARSFLKIKFTQKFSSLQGENPTSFINVTLGELKSINVHFIGNVNLPGVHLVHPMSTITTGLIQAGGIDITGSLRKIQIHRKGKLHKEIDLYSYLLNGDASENILMQNDDIVNVPTRLSTITVEGEVYRNCIYEAQQSESLFDIIMFAGGLKPKASNQMTLKRIVPMTKRTDYKEPVEYKTIMINQLKNIINQDGDVLNIKSIPAIVNEISISGQVKNPGSYVLTDSMTIKDILIRAGGIEDKNYLKSVYLDQIEIIRVDENSDFNLVIGLSYKDLLTTNKFDNFILQKDDQIIVHKNINYKKDNNIQVEGEVLIPGLYTIDKQNVTLSEIIQVAGGFTNNAFLDGIQIDRGNKKLVWDDFSIALLKGDHIFVPQKPGVIEIKGEVYNPGLIHYKKGRSVMSYVNSAGGITTNANRFNISVAYPNGNVKLAKLLPRKVKEGCIITVQRKPEKDPVDIGNLIRETISLVSSAALTYFIIQSIK